MNDASGAVVLIMTAITILAAGQMIGGKIQRVLSLIAINILAVSAIFTAFAASVDVGAQVRPTAKFIDGIAALAAAFSLTTLLTNRHQAD